MTRHILPGLEHHCLCEAFSLTDFFLMWTIFKVFIEFVTILFLFYVLAFLATMHMGS